MPIYRSLPPRRRSKSGLRTKRASARKTASCGNGRGEERGLDSPPTNATRAPISSAPSVRPKARARRWRCRLPTLRRCSSISRKSAATSLSARMPCSSSIALAGTPRPISSCPRTSRRSLPSRAPELNPVENVWQYMRQNWLSNRVFETYADIVDAICEAWNKLTARPDIITSIGMRQWAHVGQR